MHPAFQFHKLGIDGQMKAAHIAEIFDTALQRLTTNQVPGGDILVPEGRYRALLVTHLEIACFVAKKAMAERYAERAESDDAGLGELRLHGPIFRFEDLGKEEIDDGSGGKYQAWTTCVALHCPLCSEVLELRSHVDCELVELSKNRAELRLQEDSRAIREDLAPEMIRHLMDEHRYGQVGAERAVWDAIEEHPHGVMRRPSKARDVGDPAHGETSIMMGPPGPDPIPIGPDGRVIGPVPTGFDPKKGEFTYLKDGRPDPEQKG